MEGFALLFKPIGVPKWRLFGMYFAREDAAALGVKLTTTVPSSETKEGRTMKVSVGHLAIASEYRVVKATVIIEEDAS